MNQEFSVLMSVYFKDNADYLKDSIDSILNQTLMPNEIIIVKDGILNLELDNLLENYYNNFPILFKIVSLPTNSGLANALNKGISICSNELIARMDADDICFPDRFEKQINFFSINDVDILGGQILEFGKNKRDIISQRRVPVSYDEIVKFMKYRSPFSHPTILIKKTVYEALGGYDISIFPEDYLLFVKAYLNGYKFANLQENILWYRIGDDRSKALKRRWGYQYAKNEFKLYRKFFQLGYYTATTFFTVILIKIPLRIIPFSIFKLIYFKALR
jgi:glycosyltransferase involved in cell wall biosynthesis